MGDVRWSKKKVSSFIRDVCRLILGIPIYWLLVLGLGWLSGKAEAIPKAGVPTIIASFYLNGKSAYTSHQATKHFEYAKVFPTNDVRNASLFLRFGFKDVFLLSI